MKPTTNYLGEFLQALREQRGFANIREYVRHYKLRVGYVYYTEIEAGKKYLALETAKQLCESLDADFLLFYSNLLKDILPNEVQNDFLNLIPLSKNADPNEIARKEAALKTAYQNHVLACLTQTRDSSTATLNAHQLISETQTTIKDINGSLIPNPHTPNYFYGIVGLNKQKQEELARLIADLRVEFDSYNDPSAHQSQVMAIALSPIHSDFEARTSE